MVFILRISTRELGFFVSIQPSTERSELQHLRAPSREDGFCTGSNRDLGRVKPTILLELAQNDEYRKAMAANYVRVLRSPPLQNGKRWRPIKVVDYDDDCYRPEGEPSAIP